MKNQTHFLLIDFFRKGVMPKPEEVINFLEVFNQSVFYKTTK